MLNISVGMMVCGRDTNHAIREGFGRRVDSACEAAITAGSCHEAKQNEGVQPKCG